MLLKHSHQHKTTAIIKITQAFCVYILRMWNETNYIDFKGLSFLSFDTALKRLSKISKNLDVL